MRQPKGNIALVTSAHIAGFNVELAARLKALAGRRVILYVQGRESVAAHRKYLDKGMIDEIVDWGLFHQLAMRQGDETEIHAQARQMERWLGVPLSHFLMARRDAGRGFALAGLYHPHSRFSRSVTHAQLLNGMVGMLQFWRSEIEARCIGLLIGGNKEAAAVSRKMNVPFRTLYPTRVKNYYYWAHDEFVAPPHLRAVYENVGDRERPPVVLSEPYQHDTGTRKVFVGNNGLPRFLKFALMVIKRELYLRYKDYHGPQTYLLSDLLRYHWRYWRDSEYLKEPNTTPLSRLKGRPFVFFPLQTEPEYSMQVMSPEHFNQLGAIASLARDLPAGTVLAVKETIWGLGRRPRDFYRQIQEFSNVVMLNLDERGVDVIREATAVATISGSAGIEAAQQGCPVILFGRHNGYEFLPHVTMVQREEDLASVLERIFAGAIDLAQAVAAGSRYTEALERLSFDMADFAAFRRDGWTPENVEVAATELLASLESGWDAAQNAEKERGVRA